MSSPIVATHIMTIGGAFVELGRFLDECETGDCGVADVSLVGCDPAGNPGEIRAEFDVRLTGGLCDQAEDAFAVRDLDVGPDGTLTAALETTETLLPTSDYSVDADVSAFTIEEDGTICVTLSTTVRTNDDPTGRGTGTCSLESRSTNGGREAVESRTSPESANSVAPGATEQARDSVGPSSSSSDNDASPDEERRVDSAVTTSRSDTATGASASTERELPPFKDPDLLREVYESCNTFAEMADAIEMDVTAETVRRYMIDFDIHEPKSYSSSDEDYDTNGTAKSVTDAARSQEESRDPEASDARDVGPGSVSGHSADSEAETQVVLSDGIGLPEDVTAETLIETVRRSNTLYEVKQDVGIDRQDALQMLQDLNLLDLVMGRLTTETDREISREDIIERLREASATE